MLKVSGSGNSGRHLIPVSAVMPHALPDRLAHQSVSVKWLWVLIPEGPDHSGNPEGYSAEQAN